jgi:hypothetical protein
MLVVPAVPDAPDAVVSMVVVPVATVRVGPSQEPELQVPPTGHVVPQVPQLFTSVNPLVSQPAVPEHCR